MNPFRNLPLLLAAALLGLAACGSEGNGTSAGKLRIAVIPKGTTHEFWKAVHAGAEAAARAHGAEVIWKGPLKEDDRAAQIKVVEDFIARGVDGIVLMPLDNRALVPVAKEAAGQGIPVMIADSDLDWDGRVSFVATDNYHGGELAAEALGELLGGQGTALVMRYLEGSASTMAREAGFLDKLAADFPGVEIVSSNQYAGATTESAYSTAENLLQNFGEVSGIFCPNESSAFGMLRALQDSGRAGEARFVGFDSSPKLLEGLRARQIDALILQNPVAMGRLAVEAMVEHLGGGAVEQRIDTGATVATPANLDSAEIAALLSPDLSILGE
ncbi:MAG: substrate-binding domain-containing protein [Planctomycetes bacterium]|nr:substrate-binding domain-containing protein [Planctomycetota bacterium]